MSPTVGWGPKLAMVFAIAYAIWPADLVPDLAPIITWLDDFGVMGLALAWLRRDVNRFAQREAQKKRTKEDSVRKNEVPHHGA